MNTQVCFFLAACVRTSVKPINVVTTTIARMSRAVGMAIA